MTLEQYAAASAGSLQTVLDASPHSLLVVDRQGVVARTNRSALELMPDLRTREPLRGRAPDWLSALLMTHRHCDAAGVRLRLTNQGEGLARILSATGTAALFGAPPEPSLSGSEHPGGHQAIPR